jgi:Rieske Fe-S protein
VVVFLVGFVVSRSVIVIGAVVAVVFGFFWVRDLTRRSSLAEAPEVEPERRPPRPPRPAPRPARPRPVGEPMPRNVFLEVSTLGLGAVIGGLVTLPVLGLTIGPAFLRQGVPPIDLGPLSGYPEGEYQITTFLSNPPEGTVSRRTAFVRYNGFLGREPSFTIISNRCAHLGCPVQPNGELPLLPNGEINPHAIKHYKGVSMIAVNPSGFGCPCHGGQYDTEGNRIAGPPVRALDRYSFSIVNGHLAVGAPFSVAKVDGTGANAVIHAATWHYPGEPAQGLESWLYPIQPPHPDPMAPPPTP